MRLRRLSLAHFRGVDACDLELLPAGSDAGVTVIEGPNEAGKTSVADALWMLFDHAHTSQRRDVKDLQPAGTDVGTSVALEFDHDGLQVTYRKTFNRGAGASLAVRGRRTVDLTGKEAHEGAQALLSEMVDVDLWRTLHVPQGRIARPDIGDNPALLAALDGVQHAAGEGPHGPEPAGMTRGSAGGGALDERDLVVAGHIARELGRWRTATGRDRRSLTDLAAREQQVRAELDEAQEAVEAVAADLDEIARLRAALPEHRAESTRAARDLAALEQQVHQVARHREALVRSEEVLAAARARADVARQAAERRRELREEAAAAQTLCDLGGPAGDPDDVGEPGVLATARRAHDEAEAARVAAAEQLDDRRRALADRRARHARLLDRAELEALLARRRQLVQLDEQIDGLSARIDAAPVDDEVLRRLRAASSTVTEARAAAAAARVAVTVTALADVDVDTGAAEPLRLERGAAARVDVHGAGSLTVGDVVRIDLDPGAAAADLGLALAAAEEELRAALCASGVAELDEAESLHAAYAADVRQRHAAVAEREALAQLDSFADLEARLAVVTARLGEVGASGGEGVDADEGVLRGQVAAAAEAVRAAEEDLDAAEGVHREADAAAQRAKRHLERVRAEDEQGRVTREVARRAAARARERLDAARAGMSDSRVAQEVASREAEETAALQARAAAALAVETAGADATEELRAAAFAAVQTARSRLREDEQRLAGLEAAVAARSDDGPVSRRDALRVRLESVRAEADRARRRADAAQLASDVLDRHRVALRRRYLHPLRTQIERLGALLWGPDFAVELDDDLRVHRRHVAGQALDFTQLSLGAQEQLTLISRVACAIVVGPQGAPLIVDDALGFSDPDRLRRMGAVLAIAGRTTQLIVLTCHPHRYAHVGGARTLRLRGSTPGRRDPAAA